MKKLLALLLTLALVTGLAACGGGSGNDTGAGSGAGQTGGTNQADDVGGEFRVVLAVPGNLGDRSFFDSANAGLQRVNQELTGVTTRVVEMGRDETVWEPTLLDLSEAGYDIVISGGAATDIMNSVAERFPDNRYINFDNSVTDVVPANVFSIEYLTGGASFLAGALAALITTSDMELANPEPLIGFMGGMDIPGINDFLVAYIQGAQHINPDIRVITSYVGAFNDPVLGLEIGLLQYGAGVDISFNVAGQSGLGLIGAAFESNAYVIGVDADQAQVFFETDPDNAHMIVTSVLKNIDLAVYEAVRDAMSGDLEFGQHVVRVIQDGGVGIARNQFYEMIPVEIRDRVRALEESIMAGEIEVLTAFAMTTEEIEHLRSSVAP